MKKRLAFFCFLMCCFVISAIAEVPEDWKQEAVDVFNETWSTTMSADQFTWYDSDFDSGDGAEHVNPFWAAAGKDVIRHWDEGEYCYFEMIRNGTEWQVVAVERNHSAIRAAEEEDDLLDESDYVSSDSEENEDEAEEEELTVYDSDEEATAGDSLTPEEQEELQKSLSESIAQDEEETAAPAAVQQATPAPTATPSPISSDGFTESEPMSEYQMEAIKKQCWRRDYRDRCDDTGTLYRSVYSLEKHMIKKYNGCPNCNEYSWSYFTTYYDRATLNVFWYCNICGQGIGVTRIRL